MAMRIPRLKRLLQDAPMLEVKTPSAIQAIEWRVLKMSNTSRLIDELHDIAALDEALRHHLKSTENCLNSLFHKREKAARIANSGRWDQDQYLLDDLQQKLSDISELLDEFKALPRPLDQFLAD